jgi:hypothetical protein
LVSVGAEFNKRYLFGRADTEFILGVLRKPADSQMRPGRNADSDNVFPLVWRGKPTLENRPPGPAGFVPGLKKGTCFDLGHGSEADGKGRKPVSDQLFSLNRQTVRD